MILAENEIIDIYLEKINNYDLKSISDGLTQGKLGLIIYYLSLYKKNSEEIYLEKIGSILEQIFQNLENNNLNNLYRNNSISSGLSGLSYVINLLIEEGVLDDEYLSEVLKINSIVFESTKETISINNFDYLNGAIGNLWYLFRMGEYDSLFILIDVLNEKSEKDDYLFYTDSEDPYVNAMNFGFAHGYLGFVNLLLSITDKLGNSKNIDALIEKLFAKILEYVDYNYKVEDINIYKPYKIYLDKGFLKVHQNNRLAWCNSDLTFSYILLKAGQILKNDFYNELGKKIGLETVKRKSMNVTGVENDHFCHGSSGVAFLYEKLYQITNEDLFNNASGYWKDRTKSYLLANKENEFQERDMSLLYGRIGSLMVLDDTINTSKYLEVLI